jgi:transposase-like protein
MKPKELKETLNYIKQGATLDRIAKHYDISTRTLQRKLRNYKEDVKIARASYEAWLDTIFYPPQKRITLLEKMIKDIKHLYDNI